MTGMAIIGSANIVPINSHNRRLKSGAHDRPLEPVAGQHLDVIGRSTNGVVLDTFQSCTGIWRERSRGHTIATATTIALCAKRIQ